MLKEARQQQLLDYMYRDGKVNVNELSHIFSVSKDTIRRDLAELEESGVLKRGYGGAIPSKRVPLGFSSRMSMEKNSKYIIAKKAVAYLKPGSFIAIDGGSTNLLFASLLPISIELTVVTNSFPVAEKLQSHPNIKVIFLGGECNKRSCVTVGDIACSQLKGYHFDQCFLGIYGIDSQFGLSVPSPYEDEVSVKQFLVENSSIVNVMGAVSKLDQIANHIICNIADVDRIFCDDSVSEDIQKKYEGKII